MFRSIATPSLRFTTLSNKSLPKHVSKLHFKQHWSNTIQQQFNTLTTTTHNYCKKNINQRQYSLLLNHNFLAINKKSVITTAFPSTITISNKRYLSSRKDQKGKPDRFGYLASAAMGASVLFGKAKYLVVALKITKLGPLLSMVMTSFAYSFFYGWPFAVGMVGLIFVHECGHLLVMRRYKIPYTPMVFIPFMGAMIGMKESPKSIYDDAMVAFGGPVLGSMAALAVGGVGIALQSQFLLGLADFGYMINLFNLMPIASMDGGRIAAAISPYFSLAGLIGGAALAYYGMVHNPLFYMILLFGGYSVVSRFFGWDDGFHSKEFYKTTPARQIKVAAAYIALIGTILFAMNFNNKYRLSPKQLQALKAKSSDGTISMEAIDDFRYSLTEKEDGGVYDDYFEDFFAEKNSSSDKPRD